MNRLREYGFPCKARSIPSSLYLRMHAKGGPPHAKQWSIAKTKIWVGLGYISWEQCRPPKNEMDPSLRGKSDKPRQRGKAGWNSFGKSDASWPEGR